MTALELIQEINAVGGTVELAPGGRIRVTHAPRHLAPELKRLKPELVRHIEQENFERLECILNLKPVTRARMREITSGQPWRIVSAKPQPGWQIRYRWQQVCHNGSCDAVIEMSARGRVCSRCYPFANAARGRLVHVSGKCGASIHAAEHMLWQPAPDQSAAAKIERSLISV